jgi:hypothetical protein
MWSQAGVWALPNRSPSDGYTHRWPPAAWVITGHEKGGCGAPFDSLT